MLNLTQIIQLCIINNLYQRQLLYIINHIKTYRHKLQLLHNTCANDNRQIASVRFNV